MWHDLLQKDTREGAKFLKVKDPETFILKRKVIMETLRTEHGECYEHQTGLKFLVNKLTFDDYRTKIITGPSGIGKTWFAKSHFTRGVYITSDGDWSGIPNDPEKCNGIVIDDINLSVMDPHKLIHILDVKEETAVNIKYGWTCMPRFLPRIIVLNSLEFLLPPKLSIVLSLS